MSSKFDPTGLYETTAAGPVAIISEPRADGGKVFTVRLTPTNGSPHEDLHMGGSGEQAYAYFCGFVTGAHLATVSRV